MAVDNNQGAGESGQLGLGGPTVRTVEEREWVEAQLDRRIADSERELGSQEAGQAREEIGDGGQAEG
jgi:hypothetical protein